MGACKSHHLYAVLLVYYLWSVYQRRKLVVSTGFSTVQLFPLGLTVEFPFADGDIHSLKFCIFDGHTQWAVSKILVTFPTSNIIKRLLSLHRALSNLYIIHSRTKAPFIKPGKDYIYIKIRIIIAPTYFGLRPSSGSLYRAWLTLHVC